MAGLEDRLGQLTGNVSKSLTAIEGGPIRDRIQRFESELDRMGNIVSALCEFLGFSMEEIQRPVLRPAHDRPTSFIYHVCRDHQMHTEALGPGQEDEKDMDADVDDEDKDIEEPEISNNPQKTVVPSPSRVSVREEQDDGMDAEGARARSIPAAEAEAALHTEIESLDTVDPFLPMSASAHPIPAAAGNSPSHSGTPTPGHAPADCKSPPLPNHPDDIGNGSDRPGSSHQLPQSLIPGGRRSSGTGQDQPQIVSDSPSRAPAASQPTAGDQVATLGTASANIGVPPAPPQLTPNVHLIPPTPENSQDFAPPRQPTPPSAPKTDVHPAVLHSVGDIPGASPAPLQLLALPLHPPEPRPAFQPGPTTRSQSRSNTPIIGPVTRSRSRSATPSPVPGRKRRADDSSGPDNGKKQRRV